MTHRLFFRSALATSVAAATLACGCTTADQMSNVEPGMTRAQVVQILGKPDGFQTEGSYNALKYNNRLASAWAWDRADYFVILKDDRVVECGQGEVRVKNSPTNALFLVPLK